MIPTTTQHDVDIASLLSDIRTKGTNFLSDSVSSPEELRTALLHSAQHLVTALQSPYEVIARMNWLEPTRWAITRVGLDLRLFEAMMEHEGGPKTVERLAEVTACDGVLLSRMLKHLNAAGFVHETGVDEYAANGITAALATRIPAGMTKNCFDLLTTVLHSLPTFLSQTKYANPSKETHTPFNHALNTQLTYWSWLSEPGRHAEQEAYQAHMAFKTLGKKWFEADDIASSLLPSLLSSSSLSPCTSTESEGVRDPVFLVDIGGSTGHDLVSLLSSHPTLPSHGRLILQDLPSTLSSIPPSTLPTTITLLPHDFFTPQPLSCYGARIFYLHSILHDWPDALAAKILANIVPAMRRGWSKILLNEIVVQDKGAGWVETSVDVMMMVAHGARERTEQEWRGLIEGVGLRVCRVWGRGERERVVECELA
ncbi:O-methyltransferase-domain-containing protein [Clohesyomyces aquaticus]|uniref:O-methyltransferase-domain-containing protein n=1 Tax=Clohesyomyces aquaticus TaxID=1231657 RepID=A0A1Y1YZG6_9PLEO|nr:O-methyltransferase-domain-containing protein [Clohesyomyces aquaticus]